MKPAWLTLAIAAGFIIGLSGHSIAAALQASDAQAATDNNDAAFLCRSMSLEEYNRVLTDPDNAQTHYVLAATYQALGEAQQPCTVDQ